MADKTVNPTPEETKLHQEISALEQKLRTIEKFEWFLDVPAKELSKFFNGLVKQLDASARLYENMVYTHDERMSVFRDNIETMFDICAELDVYLKNKFPGEVAIAVAASTKQVVENGFSDQKDTLKEVISGLDYLKQIPSQISAQISDAVKQLETAVENGYAARTQEILASLTAVVDKNYEALGREVKRMQIESKTYVAGAKDEVVKALGEQGRTLLDAIAANQKEIQNIRSASSQDIAGLRTELAGAIAGQGASVSASLDQLRQSADGARIIVSAETLAIKEQIDETDRKCEQMLTAQTGMNRKMDVINGRDYKQTSFGRKLALSVAATLMGTAGLLWYNHDKNHVYTPTESAPKIEFPIQYGQVVLTDTREKNESGNYKKHTFLCGLDVLPAVEAYRNNAIAENKDIGIVLDDLFKYDNADGKLDGKITAIPANKSVKSDIGDEGDVK